MKIIEKVKYNGTWYTIVKCTGNSHKNSPSCGSTLEVTLEDLVYFKEVEYPWRTAQAAVTFKCPVCKGVTDISRKYWPKNISKITKWSSEWEAAHTWNN